MTAPLETPLTGHCTCGSVRYELQAAPMYVHCCHCSWCQREAGSAFALNALIESSQLKLLSGMVEETKLASKSGYGQVLKRCPSCKVVLWSHYGGAKEAVSFVRVGTLDEPGRCPPDIHIYTTTKLPWVILDDRVPVMEEFYQRSKLWPPESVERYKKCLGK